MTRQELPDLGARPAPAASGYDQDSTLPTHVGEPIVKVVLSALGLWMLIGALVMRKMIDMKI